MRWTGYIAHMIEMRNAYKIVFKEPERKDYFYNRGCRIILKLS
jgi:hypothetical protein